MKSSVKDGILVVSAAMIQRSSAQSASSLIDPGGWPIDIYTISFFTDWPRWVTYRHLRNQLPHWLITVGDP